MATQDALREQANVSTDGTMIRIREEGWKEVKIGAISRLDWTAPADGTAYLLVKHWNPAVAGCGTRYALYLNGVRIFVPLVYKQ